MFAIFAMIDICIKFCFKLSKNAADTHWMPQQAFCDQALNRARTLERFRRFKDGRESVEDNERSGDLRFALQFRK